mgnify:CR=1 FL=1
MCGIQLELVEAAHIIPHSHEKGTDEIGNGISLCALHHAAYDRSLIFFDEEFNVLINDKKMEVSGLRFSELDERGQACIRAFE